MSRQPTILVRAASKVFRFSRSEVSFAESLLRLLRRSAREAVEVVAVRDVDLRIEPGEWVGIVGDNGAGKSTLLRLLAGIYAPTGGSVELNGRAVLLAGFGTGMVDELSVEENVFLYGTIYGLEREKLTGLLPEILEWAQITAFRRARLATLSTGMKGRLAFSVLRHLQADVFLLDEALSAGDRTFHEKCRQHFLAARDGQATYVIAGHDLEFVRQHCDRALWLDAGEIRHEGPVEEVLDRYSEVRPGQLDAGRTDGHAAS